MLDKASYTDDYFPMTHVTLHPPHALSTMKGKYGNSLENFPTIHVGAPIGCLRPIGLRHQKRPEIYNIWIPKEQIMSQAKLLAQRLVLIENLTLVPILRGAAPFENMVGRMIHKIDPQNRFQSFSLIAKRTLDDKPMDKPPTIYAGHVDPREVNGRNIVILEDLLDSGETINEVAKLIESKIKAGEWKPLSVRTVVVLDKRDRESDFNADATLFSVPRQDANGSDLWFCGFGMDYSLAFRYLEDIIDVRNPAY